MLVQTYKLVKDRALLNCSSTSADHDWWFVPQNRSPQLSTGFEKEFQVGVINFV